MDHYVGIDAVKWRTKPCSSTPVYTFTGRATDALIQAIMIDRPQPVAGFSHLPGDPSPGLLEKGEPLVELAALIDFEAFRPKLATAL